MNEQPLHIRNVHLIDPKNGLDACLDLFLADGRVAAIGPPPAGFSAERRIDATGLIVCPGYRTWETSSPSATLSTSKTRYRMGDADIEQLIVDRGEARKTKNFKESDRIRDLLAANGVVLEDQPGGKTLWRRG